MNAKQLQEELVNALNKAGLTMFEADKITVHADDGQIHFVWGENYDQRHIVVVD